jgi:flavin reductase (DIM6/NTAB) family NADH-FMN oxidoreductase RutF
MNPKSLYNIPYGLYLLTARENNKDNGCIINTVMQVSENPTHICISVNKNNLTHDMILHTRSFNVSTLSTSTGFDFFKHFGMQSGRTVDKFAEYPDIARSANGLLYLTNHTNAYFSAKVTMYLDLGSHTLFVGELVEAEAISSEETCTYSYYQSNIKPKPVTNSSKTTWTCTVCGYVHESEELPDDFICPLCKHGKSDFVKTVQQ